MPKYLSEGRTRLVRLASTPADIDAIDVTEAAAGTLMSGLVLTTSVIGPSGSDTISEKVLSSVGNAQTFGASNFDGNFLVIHRYFDSSDLQPDPSTDAEWTALKTKGTTVRLLWRKSAKLASAAFADGDEYRYAEYITDDPIDESGDGYQKYRIPLAYQGVSSLDKTIAADS